MPIQKSPETGALPDMATRQCQKSGNGFPPPAAFLPLDPLSRAPPNNCGSGLARESGASGKVDID
jgi:hypothetical protein